MKIVLDTNVIVSAQINDAGAPARVLSLVLSGALQLLLDDRIFAEYQEVLARERFGFDAGRIAAVLDALAAAGEQIAVLPLDVASPDPDDLPFLEVAVAGRADAVVTGNAKHFRHVAGVKVVTPRELLELLHAES